jgi:hypothetical protein
MMRRRLRRASVVAALVAGSACSLIAPSDLDRVRCSEEGKIGPPACEVGQICGAGVCTACAATEVCGDRVDNDCNGSADDGCGGSGAGGSSGQVSFGGTSGGSPDASTGGMSGGAAGAPLGGSSGAGGDASGGASGGEAGSSGAGTGGSPAIGTPCAGDSACASGDFCADARQFLLTGGSICMRGCCRSEDCDGGSVCWPTPAGPNLCLPIKLVSRATPGAVAAGGACSEHGDCRSGHCENERCLDTCCSHTNCAQAGGDCTLRALPGTTRMTFLCGAGPGGGNTGEWCTSGGNCRSGVCDGGFRCTRRCCSQVDCGSGRWCPFTTLVSSSGWAVPVCNVTSNSGTTPNGQACGTDTDCASRRCRDFGAVGKLCTDACCSDLDCGSASLPVCRPYPGSPAATMFCAPP